MILNTIVADSLAYIAGELEAAKGGQARTQVGRNDFAAKRGNLHDILLCIAADDALHLGGIAHKKDCAKQNGK